MKPVCESAASSARSFISALAVELTYRHDPDKNALSAQMIRIRAETRHAPKDINANVEHSHEETYALEEIANEQHANCAGLGGIHDSQNVRRNDTDQHLCLVESLPEQNFRNNLTIGKIYEQGKSLRRLGISTKRESRTRKAHAGVNVVTSCGLLYQIINIGKETRTARKT
jgi:translation initiation factor 1 (eIF-1/SUI1)